VLPEQAIRWVKDVIGPGSQIVPDDLRMFEEYAKTVLGRWH